MFKHGLLGFLISFTIVISLVFLHERLPDLVTDQKTQTNHTSQSADISPTTSDVTSDTLGIATTPWQLTIPKLDISTYIIAVSMTEGHIEVPSNAAWAGWFDQGAKPGEEGAVVILGHYETLSGKPALFYNLKTLRLDDEVSIETPEGRHIYSVKEKQVVPFEDKISAQVEANLEMQLILMSAGSVWNPKRKSYTDRIVVTAQYKERTKNL